MNPNPPTDKLAERLEELAEHVSDVHFTCDIVHALARAVIQLRHAMTHDSTRARLEEIDAELAKALGVTK